MGVEHIQTRFETPVGELQDAALRLALHDGVHRLEGRLQRGAVVVIIEEIGVQVQGVDRVELGDVDQINALQLVAANRDGLVVVGESNRVGRVDLIVAVKVGVEAVHHHDHLVDPLILGVVVVARLGDLLLLAAVFLRVGVDDESAVETLVNVAFERDGVAVVEMAAERESVELVNRALPRADHPSAHAWHAVHRSRVDAVEVDRVGV